MIEQMPQLSALEELKKYPQWVCYPRTSKLPLNPHTGKGADCNDPGTWATYAQARAVWQGKRRWYAGIGFEFVREQGITGIDLDGCVVDGQLSAYACEVLAALKSYAEFSPSGTGIHLFVRGSLPDNIEADKKADGERRIEMYDHQRYFSMTGKQVPGMPDTIEDRQEELLQLYNDTLERRKATKAAQQPRAKRESSLAASGPDTAYGLAALADECQELATTPAGSRNEQLNKSAFALARLVAGGELSRGTVERELLAAADRAGLAEREAERTMQSGFEAGMKEPRKKPERKIDRGSNSLYIPPTPTQPDRPFNPTDLGNAERFALRYRDTVRWCETWNTWMVFNGKCWEADKTGRADQLAKIVVRSIYSEAAKIDDEDLRKKMAKHAAASESNRSVRAMLDRAKSELPATPDDFNTHLYLLNCENGTLDLRSGVLRPHSPHDMLTRCIKIKYNPLAVSERWGSFLEKFLDNDQDLISFMKQSLGMSLCGDTSEQCLFICHGMGSNGKTTMLETVRIIMASYASAANIETFQVRKQETIGNDIAELYGARLVTASETKLGGRLNEAFVKKATGKEPLRARRLHENEFEFMPEFTLWLAVNHKPVVLDTSKGMWRRVHFIPFNVTIDGDQVDKHFGDKLLEEAEGILAWLVQGCMEWIKQGHLAIPRVVREATAGYRAEMDIVANFLNDECTLAPGLKAQTKKIMERFESWCTHNSEKFDAKILKNSLKERGLHSEKGTGGVYYWQNIGLVDNVPLPDNELWSEENSGRSGGKGPKNRVNQELKNPPDVTLDLGPQRPLRPLIEQKEKENSAGTPTLLLEKIQPSRPNVDCMHCKVTAWIWSTSGDVPEWICLHCYSPAPGGQGHTQ